MSILTFFKNIIFGKKKNGPYSAYHSNGKVSFIGVYKDGKKCGTQKFFHRNGNLQSEVNFINDKKEGVEKKYFLNGDLKSEVNFVNGKKEGKEIIIWRPNTYKEEFKVNFLQDPTRNTNVIGGKLENPFSEDDPAEPEKRWEYNYVNGKKEGLQKKYYHKTNQLYSEEQLVNGKKEGVSRLFHKNGQLSSECHYENGMAMGWYKSFYESGKLWMEVKCEGHEYPWNGMQGLCKIYNEDGTIKEEKMYKDGKEIKT